MKVLMTGADGFIGSNVLQYMLNNTDWEFTIIASWRHHGSPLNVPLSNRVKVVTHDLRGPIPEIGNFDYILNLASESHVDRSIVAPVDFVENNVAIVLNVLEYARTHPCKQFIQFSTDEVYGAHEHSDYDILLPTNPYAASKAAQEVIALSYYSTYKVPVTITNCNNVVGKNQHPEKFIPKLVKMILNDERVDIHTSNGELGKRIYNPVENVGSALVFILGVGFEQRGNLPVRYSIIGGEQKDNLQMAKMVANILGKNLHYRRVNVHNIRPTYDNAYFESEDTRLLDYGWEPPVTLKEGLKWIKQM